VSLLWYKSFAGLFIFTISLIAVIYPIRARIYPSHNRFLELGDAFASGIFLGVALFHMLPSAISSFAETMPAIHYPLAESFCAAGFLLLLFLERLSQYSSHHAHNHAHSLPYMLAFILVIHSLIEGAALGINATFATATIIFVAILAHKGSESFALAIILNRSTLSLKNIMITVLIFAFMTPLGILLGSSLQTTSLTGALLTAGFNAFAAGTFLYMSTLHHINHHHRANEAESLMEFLFLVIGLVIMAVIAAWA
jgi:solute carrier family 39 (zinc transporter), member 1/2/3